MEKNFASEKKALRIIRRKNKKESILNYTNYTILVTLACLQTLCVAIGIGYALDGDRIRILLPLQ